MKKFAFVLGLFLVMTPAMSALADDHVEENETQQGTMNENLPVPATVSYTHLTLPTNREV